MVLVGDGVGDWILSGVLDMQLPPLRRRQPPRTPSKSPCFRPRGDTYGTNRRHPFPPHPPSPLSLPTNIDSAIKHRTLYMVGHPTVQNVSLAPPMYSRYYRQAGGCNVFDMPHLGEDAGVWAASRCCDIMRAPGRNAPAHGLPRRAELGQTQSTRQAESSLCCKPPPTAPRPPSPTPSPRQSRC